MLAEKALRHFALGRRVALAGNPVLLGCLLCCTVVLITLVAFRGGSAGGPAAPAAAGSASVAGTAGVGAAVAAAPAMQPIGFQPLLPKQSYHLDHAKQEVLEERSKLSREEKDLTKAEKTFAKDAKELEQAQSLLRKEEATALKAGHSHKAAKQLQKFVKRADHEVEHLNRDLLRAEQLLASSKLDESQVEVVRNTWASIKQEYGVSKGIDKKHTVEETRHGKFVKKGETLAERLGQLRVQSADISRRQSLLDQQVRQKDMN